MHIAFTGSGSGGHFTPIIAVAREVKRIAEEERILDLELFYFSPDAANQPLLEAEDITFKHTSAGKFRRYFSLANIADVFRTGLGILEALWRMVSVMPDVVFAKGGYGSFPTLVAAYLYHIPVVIHESDVVPGRVSRWAGRWADRVAVSFAGAAQYFPPERTALVGAPIRKRILGGNMEEAREFFGVFSDRPVLFVTGGSQGAKVINETIIQILPELLERCEIIHQVGEANFDEVVLETASLLKDPTEGGRAGGPPPRGAPGPAERGPVRPARLAEAPAKRAGGQEAYYHIVAALDEEKMRSAYLLADLVISRAGATTIYEIAAWGKPSIVIPLKHAAQDHQRENAYEYAQGGAAVVIEEENLAPTVLAHEIQTILADGERRAKMSYAAQAFSRPGAAEAIAREIIAVGLH